MALGDVLDSFSAPDVQPTGLAWDGEHLWNGNGFPNGIYKLDPADGSVLDMFTGPGGGQVWGLTWDGAHLRSSSIALGFIYTLDPADGSIIDSFAAIPSTGLAWDGINLWASDLSGGDIYKLDPSDGSVLDSFAAPGDQPTGLTWDGENLWSVSVVTGLIYKLDPADGSVLDSFAAPGGLPTGLAWDGEHLWSASIATGLIYKLEVPVPVPLGITETYRWSIAPSPARIDLALAGRVTSPTYTFRFERRTKTGQYIDDVTPAISRAYMELNNNRAILRTAEFTIDSAARDSRGRRIEWNFLRDHVQVVMELLVDGSYWLDVPMGLYVLSAPSRQITSGSTLLTVRANDLSIYLAQDMLASSHLVPQGANYISAVESVFDDLGLRHRFPPSSLTLPLDSPWDAGAPRLEVVNSLLQGAGMYIHWFDATGVATTRNLEELAARTPDATYTGNDFVLTPIEDEQDTNRLANRVVVVVTDPDRPGMAGVATNMDPDSPISVPNLGRIISKRLERDSAATQQILNEAAQRELEASASLYERATLLTPIDPRRDAREVYRLDVDGVYEDSRWWVQGWSVDYEPANPPAVMTHNLGRVVRISGGVG